MSDDPTLETSFTIPACPPRFSARSHLGCGLLATALLSACTKLPPAPDTMPDSYGKVQKVWLGCPDFTGLYAWPPVDHPAPEVRVTGRHATSAKFLDLPVYAEAQIWVNGPSKDTHDALEVRTRMVNRDPRLRIASLTAHWSYLLRSYRCDGSWAAWEDPPDETHRYVRTGRMALLEDGSLAVGQAARETHVKLPLFSWGGQSYGSVPGPDRIRTGWLRLRRIGPTGKDLPPVDAALEEPR